MNYQPGMSSKDMMQSVLYARLNKDGTEESISKMLLTDLATSSVSTIADSNRRSTEGTVSSLVRLVELQFDTDSDIVKDMLETDTAIRKSLVKISDRIPDLLR